MLTDNYDISAQAQVILEKPLADNTVSIKTADMLDNSPVEWLIPNWIPKKGITLLSSDGGIGKTFVWCSIIAALSKGTSTFLRYDPDMNSEKKVLCISGEDPENVLRSRLEKAGAKLENIYVIAQDTQTEEITFDSEYLQLIVEKCKPVLLVFDPLQAFIGSKVDMSRRNQMRQALRPLAILSSEHDMPVLIVMHTNKRQDADGRNKLADSSDIWDIARAVLMCGFTEENERYISLEKASYTDHLSVPSVLFNLEGGKVHFAGTTEKKMSDFNAEKKQRTAEAEPKTSKLNDCCTALLSLFAEHGGQYDGNLLTADLSEIGFSSATIKRAKAELITAGHIRYSRDNKGNVTYYRKSAKDHQFSPPEQ